VEVPQVRSRLQAQGFLFFDNGSRPSFVGAPESGPAAVQYDLGQQTTYEIQVTRTLNKPPGLLLRVVGKVDNEYQRAEEGEDGFFAKHLQRFAKFPRMRELYKRPCTSDRLFQASYEHEDGTQCISHDQSCEVSRPDRNPGDIRIHYSTILSGDLVIKSAKIRDQLSCKFHGALCFEMGAAGLMDVFLCLVIRGICNYSDSHKNNDWQEYAAATAAAYAREILLSMAERVVEELNHSATENSKAPEETQPIAVNFFGKHIYGVQLGQNTGSMGGLLDEALDFPFPADHTLDDSSIEGVRRRAHVASV